MRSTLWHFVDLEVSAREVDEHVAAAEEAALDSRRGPRQRRTIHLLSDSNHGAAYGAPIDNSNSALGAEPWPLSSGNKCALCRAMVSRP